MFSLFSKLKKKDYFLIALLLLSIVFVVVVYYAKYGNKKVGKKTGGSFPESVSQTNSSYQEKPTLTLRPSRVPTSTPTPYPLPQGKQRYLISNGKNVKGPKMSEAVINPFDPKIGEKQTITIKVRHNIPVTSATVTLITDNKEKEYPLKLVAGKTTNGTWEVRLTTKDTHYYKYQAAFDLKSAVDEYQGALTFRSY